MNLGKKNLIFVIEYDLMSNLNVTWFMNLTLSLTLFNDSYLKASDRLSRCVVKAIKMSEDVRLGFYLKNNYIDLYYITTIYKIHPFITNINDVPNKIKLGNGIPV